MAPKRFLRHAPRLLALALLLGTLSVVGTGWVTPASAADNCGTGYHKQKDRSLAGRKSATFDGRVLTSQTAGTVRFCTRARTAKPDQLDQKVVIGVPSRHVGIGSISGKHRQFCLDQTVTAHISPWVSSASIGVSGTGGTGTVTITSSKVTFKARQCSGTGSRINIERAKYSVSAPNGACSYLALGWTAACYAGPFVTKVSVSQTLTATYWRNGTKHHRVMSHSVTANR